MKKDKHIMYGAEGEENIPEGLGQTEIDSEFDGKGNVTYIIKGLDEMSETVDGKRRITLPHQMAANIGLLLIRHSIMAQGMDPDALGARDPFAD